MLSGYGRGQISCMILVIALMRLWAPAMLSVYLCSAAVLTCIIAGGAIGILCAVNEHVWQVMPPICDLLQTIPLFAFLIPVLMFFQIGEFSAFLAICAYAIVPMIRYMRHGLVSSPMISLKQQFLPGLQTGRSCTRCECRMP